MLGENFTFDGISSEVYGVKMLRLGSSGFLNEKIIGDANFTEVEYPSDFRPHLQKVVRSPLEFSQQIALLDASGQPKKWTEQDRKNIFSWLFQNEYKPLTFDDRPNVVYYAIAMSNLSLNTMNETGYIDVTFRTNSPYPWRPEKIINVTGSSTSSPSKIIVLESGLATDKIYPIIELTRMGPSLEIIQVWSSNNGPASTIGVMNSKIPTVDRIGINTRFKSITDLDTGESLYKYKRISGYGFPFLIEGSNTFFIPQGWNAKIYINEPIKY